MKTRTKRSISRAIPFLIALLSIAFPGTSAWATSREEAEQALAEARALHAQAADAGAADSDAAQMIDEAAALLATRQYTKARMVAYWAVRQTEYAIKLKTGEIDAAANTAAKAEAMIAAAEEARQKAASVGGEWRDTASMIKSAQTLAGAGEFDKAIAAAEAAKFQAERGYEQAVAERNADFPAYMRKAARQ